MTDTLSALKSPTQLFPWLRQSVREIIAAHGENHSINIATGISLSGPVHVGHLREFMIGAAVHQALRDEGVTTRLYAFADDMDPLKKRYDFLPAEYQQFVGVPLYKIPAPQNPGQSYADWYLAEFRNNLAQLGIEPEVIVSSEQYAVRKYADSVSQLWSSRSAVAKILREVTGCKKDDIAPIRPMCPHCNHVTTTTITTLEGSQAQVQCSFCNQASTQDLLDCNNKLLWRYDWPTRWRAYQIHVEPVAQDHATKGGSYESASRIAREVLAQKPPTAIKYAWVKKSGTESMHTSKGSVPISELLAALPSQFVWWMYSRQQPATPIYFGWQAVVREIKEFRRMLKAAPTLPFHTMEGVDQAFLDEDIDALLDRVVHNRAIPNLSDRSRQQLRILASKLAPAATETTTIDTELVTKVIARLTTIENWNSDQIFLALQDLFTNGEDKKSMFSKIYIAILGKTQGPKLSVLLEEMGKENTISKLQAALQR